jgi:hypothetical protein
MQKLPGGVLAAHGYTTRWGFFLGVCDGAGELPYEQSKDYIETCMRRAQTLAANRRTEAAAALLDVNPAKVTVHAYLTGGHGDRSGYRWIPTRLGFDRIGRVCYWHPGDHSHAEGWRPMAVGSGRTLTEAAALAARKYADHLESEAANFDRYVCWQAERIARWAPAELTPIGRS